MREKDIVLEMEFGQSEEKMLESANRSGGDKDKVAAAS